MPATSGVNLTFAWSVASSLDLDAVGALRVQANLVTWAFGSTAEPFRTSGTPTDTFSSPVVPIAAFAPVLGSLPMKASGLAALAGIATISIFASGLAG